MTTFTPEKDNLFRGLAGGVTLRDGENEGDAGGAGTADAIDSVMTGHFCVFNQWTEICSWYEGEFLERVVPGAASKTLKENLAQVKVQFDHGYDDYIGGSPLGHIDRCEEDDYGVAYEVALIDTDYIRDRVLPLLQGRTLTGEKRGSLLGASFRFNVIRDEWNMEPKLSTYNPKGLPERTITEFKLREFGPVVWPAYAAATAGMRSLTDHFLERRREARSALTAPAALGTGTTPTNSAPHSHPLDSTARLQRFRAVLATH